jgi:hypothetical protein
VNLHETGQGPSVGQYRAMYSGSAGIVGDLGTSSATNLDSIVYIKISLPACNSVQSRSGIALPASNLDAP